MVATPALQRAGAARSALTTRLEVERMIQRGRVAALLLASGLAISFGDDRSVGVTVAVGLLLANVLLIHVLLRRPRTEVVITAAGWGSFLADAAVCATALSAVTDDPVDPISMITIMVAIEAAVRWGSRGALLGGALGGTMAVAWADASYTAVGRDLPAASLTFRLLFVVIIALPVGLLIQRLGEQQRRTQQLFDLSSDALLVVIDGRVATANPVACQLANTSTEAVVGRPFVERFGPLFGVDGISDLLRAPDEQPRRVAVPGPDDETRWFTVDAEATADAHRVFVTVRDVTQQRLREEELRFRAWHDHLTALPNRAALRSRLAARLSEADPVGVVFLDLDGFKDVNDRLGHTAGDDLLVTVADRLRQVTRDGDAAYRWAGDEFCVIVDPADPEALQAIADRITDALEAAIAVGEQIVRVRASVGTAVAQQDDTVDSLIARADRRMYRAKQQRSA